MQPNLSRDQRHLQLVTIAQSPQGKQEIERLFAACFPLGVKPPACLPVLQTILDREYGPLRRRSCR